MIGHNVPTGMDCESCFIWFHFRNTIPVLRKTVSYLRRGQFWQIFSTVSIQHSCLFYI